MNTNKMRDTEEGRAIRADYIAHKQNKRDASQSFSKNIL